MLALVFILVTMLMIVLLVFSVKFFVLHEAQDDPILRDHDSRRLDSRALSFRAPRGSPARVNHRLESPLTCEQATCEVLDMRHFNLRDPDLIS